jgi:phospholipid/cholesterol/gamma-HCH transport system substrate-binding protein
VRDAIRKHLRLFLLTIAFMSLGLGAAAYILAHQRLRFPIVEEEPFELRMELANAQAVTPGQGQTVRVSGIQVGEIGRVDLKDGHALVELKIEPKYEGLIREDATALLRPRTPLKDMFLELDPGRGKPLDENDTVPLASTQTDVNPDEFLSVLDNDTRDYLRLLINGAGRGLHGRGRDLREVFRLFEPTHRDLARVQTAVAGRRRELRRLVHSLQRLSRELAGKEDDLAELVHSAARVFRAYASEDRNISAAVHELPGALRQATDTLGKVELLADELGPASENLRPAARALGRSQVALRPLAREATPLLRSRIRPLVREARPLVRDLRPAARNLATSTPEMTRVFKVFNSFFNMLAYNPGGREGPEDAARHEGHLFWLAWVTHLSNNLFSSADAHGPLRPSLVSFSCQSARNLVNDQPQLEFELNLTPILTNPALCG